MDVSNKILVYRDLVPNWCHWGGVNYASLDDLLGLTFNIDIKELAEKINDVADYVGQINVKMPTIKMFDENNIMAECQLEDLRKESEDLGRILMELIQRRMDVFKKIDDLRGVATYHIIKGGLKAQRVESGKGEAKYEVRLSDFVKWLKKEGIEHPDGLKNCIKTNSALGKENKSLIVAIRELIAFHSGKDVKSYKIAKEITIAEQNTMLREVFCKLSHLSYGKDVKYTTVSNDITADKNTVDGYLKSCKKDSHSL